MRDLLGNKKQRFSIRKVSKIGAVSALIGTAILMGGTVVQADEVTATTPDTNAVSETQAQSNVTEQQVSDAKQNMEKAETAAVIQESATGLAQSQVNEAQSQVTEAQSQVTEAQATTANATPEAISQATEAIATAESNVPVAEKTVTEAQATAKGAQTAVTNQEAVVSDAQAASDNAQAESDAAQAKVNALTNESTDVSTAQDNVTVAEATVARATADVKTAETNLETAKTADSKLDQAISDAKGTVSTAEQGVKVAEQNVSAKEAAVSQAQTNFDQAKAAAEAAKPLATWESKVNIPEEYLTALKKWVNAKGADRVQAIKDAKAIYDKLPITTDINVSNQYAKTVTVTDGNTHYTMSDNGSVNYFYPNTIKSDDNTKYDVENLPENVSKLVNQYFVDQVNAFRRALGLPNATVNTVMMDVAKARAVKYNALRDNTDEMGHDKSIMNQTPAEVNPELKGLGVGENLTFQGGYKLFSIDKAYQKSHYATLSEILDGVRNAVFLFTVDDGDQGYGHALGLTAFDQQGISMYLQDNSTMFSAEGQALFNVVNAYSRLNDAYLRQDIAGGHVYDVLSAGQANFEPSVAAYNKALLKQTTAGAALKAAQEDVTVAKTAVTTAQKAVDNAKAKVAALKSHERQTPKAKAKLSAAKAELTEAEGKLKAAKAVLAAVTADEATKAQALTQAKANAKVAKEKADNVLVALATEQAKLAELKSVAEKANNDVVGAQKSLDNAKSAVEAAKTHKAELENAQAKLADAQAKLTDTQAKLAVAQAKLAIERAKLTDARSKYVSAKAVYDELLTKYEAQKALDDANKGHVVTPEVKPEVKPEAGKKVTKGGYGGEMVELRNQIKSASAKLRTQAVTNQVLARRGTSANYQASLPNTGDKETALYSLLGLLALGTSLALAGKRKEN